MANQKAVNDAVGILQDTVREVVADVVVGLEDVLNGRAPGEHQLTTVEHILDACRNNDGALDKGALREIISVFDGRTIFDGRAITDK